MSMGGCGWILCLLTTAVLVTSVNPMTKSHKHLIGSGNRSYIYRLVDPLQCGSQEALYDLRQDLSRSWRSTAPRSPNCRRSSCRLLRGTRALPSSRRYWFPS